MTSPKTMLLINMMICHSNSLRRLTELKNLLKKLKINYKRVMKMLKTEFMIFLMKLRIKFKKVMKMSKTEFMILLVI